MADVIPEGIRLGIVRGISYGLFGKPDTFMPQLRELGASLVRIYVYWSQVEPEPGNYTFEVVDAFLNQLDGSEEVWVTVCSSSMWATQQATNFIPPSPAKDLGTYYEFVHRLVRHCGGRVRFWQCDNEPNNVGLTWLGTAQDYVAQLKVMHRAVNDADPAAAVVLGGATYGLPASASESPERQFYDVLLRDGRDSFDMFDLHLYGPAEQILTDIHAARSDDARVWLRKAAAGRRIQRPVAEPVSRGHRRDGAGHSRCAGRERLGTDARGSRPGYPVRAHGRPAAATADVHARLPAGPGR